MADPLTLALSVAGSALSGVGAIASGVAGHQDARFQQQMHERNAQLRMQQAAMQEAGDHRDATRRLGAIRARQGASGVTGEGTPLELLADQALELETQILANRWAAQQQATGHRIQGQAVRARGNAALIEGGLGGAVGFAQAGQTLLGRSDRPRGGAR